MTNVDLFFPEVDDSCWARVSEVLGSKFIGQGPRVDEFELAFQEKFCPGRHAVMVSSGTAALHLAYVLAGVGPGSEVISPNFTCTATNIPLLHLGATPVLADISPGNMTLDADAAYHLMTPKTKAIVSVNYAGYHVNTKKLRDMAPKTAIISDCAQSLEYNDQDEADYLCFSFQAIKLLTASNGGCLVTRTAMEATIAKRLRWFGITREAKLRGNWENDIREAGYKAQMTDVEAAIGLGNLTLIDERLAYRRKLLSQYKRELQGCRHTRLAGEDQIGTMHDAWLATIITTEMTRVTQALKAGGIEHGPVHYRNDRYTIFKEKARIGSTEGMDSVDGRYLCVPLHCKVTPEDVSRICDLIRSA